MSSDDNMPEIGPNDVVFDCPACHKSMVVDGSGAGLSVECPGCAAQVIIPPKPDKKPDKTAVPPPPPPAGVDPRLLSLFSKLKELQTQRIEVGANIASRLNDINRQMVILSRLENSHQQLMQDWSRLVAELRPGCAGNSQANFKA
jgi:hypothetical protein